MPANNINLYIYRFWSEVDPEIIELIDQPWSYKSDLDMFGYTIKEYLDNILYIQLWLINSKNKSSWERLKIKCNHSTVLQTSNRIICINHTNFSQK